MAINLPARNQNQISTVTPKPRTVKDLILASKDAISEALPKHLDVDRFARVALTTVKSSKALMQCDAKSLVGALIQCSILGLEPSGMTGEAYIVPFGKEAQLIIGYRGFMKLARQSGQITNIYSRIVYQNEPFKLTVGTDPKIEHTPIDPGERGRPVGAYAVAVFKGGGVAFEYLYKSEIENIGKSSRAFSSPSSPWQRFPDSMWKKTVIRQLAKFLPLSVELQQAVTLDEMAEAGKRQPTAVDDGSERNNLIGDVVFEDASMDDSAASSEPTVTEVQVAHETPSDQPSEQSRAPRRGRPPKDQNESNELNPETIFDGQ